VSPRAEAIAAAAIAAAFVAACRDELAAPKPGNVHVFAPGHRMTANDFVRSAAAASGPIATTGARVGARIHGAIEATLAAVGTNTNLGIVLLCAPLAAAAELGPGDLRAAVGEILAGLDAQDADLAFGAIVRAAPAGLGRAERHDVFAPAVASLRDAMAEAADRDRIALQYVTEYADVFELGEPALNRATAQGWDPTWSTLAVYLSFVAAFPDTHIVRRNGAATAENIRRLAAELNDRMRPLQSPEMLLPDLLTWDAALKRDGINPGTSADLTVATLFAHRLRNVLLPPGISD
jgi:triphosphoribosyl-dephospho-CoA synthase